jgi:proteasome lid subunit RPN8/RPN11
MPAVTAWTDPGCPIPVHYSREALEQIRRVAVEGLLSLPRIGVGVGGLLLGNRQKGRITILDSMPIPCSHAAGPPFRLTAEETRQALEMARSAGPLTVVGWYCSKTRGPAALFESDLALFGSLCPESWQMALVIRPSTVEASHVTLCFRSGEGLILQGAECPLEPFNEMPVHTEPAAPPKPAAVKPAAPTKPVVAVRAAVSRAETPVATEAPSPKIQPRPPIEPAPLQAEPGQPLLQAATPPPAAARWKTRLAGWMLVVSAILAGAGAAFFTHPEWMFEQRLQLSASDANGHLTIRWNPGAVRGIAHASLTLNDGGEPHTIPLDTRQLAGGETSYERKSPHVDALMQADGLRAQVSYPQ